jgi:hypothetical protein
LVLAVLVFVDPYAVTIAVHCCGNKYGGQLIAVGIAVDCSGALSGYLFPHLRSSFP